VVGSGEPGAPLVRLFRGQMGRGMFGGLGAIPCVDGVRIMMARRIDGLVGGDEDGVDGV
jgi:hypothetical protein